MTTYNWEPSLWRFIHFFSLHGNGRKLFQKLPQFVPCEAFKAAWLDPLPDENLVTWSVELRNRVNESDKWTVDDVHKEHNLECDYLTEREHMFSFPWGFIHNLAKTAVENGNEEAVVDFLIQFDYEYPGHSSDETLRFFQIFPNKNETILDWTIHRHKRMNQRFDRPEFHYTSS